MERCDVLVVGGGPCGSAAATRLVRAGRDVVVLDRAAFPRDKVCTGWITLPVVDAIDLDLEAYGAGHTLQPFTGFALGRLDRETRVSDYGRPISYGIRRVEFDDWLLRRSGARLRLGEPLGSLRRDGDEWIVNDAVRTPMVIGAGGHFCPVARQLRGPARGEHVVVAQHAEYRDDGRGTVAAEVPELFFWPDLLGYGWFVRKDGWINVGAGRLTHDGFPAARHAFTTMLQDRGWLADPAALPWKGHAYLLNRTSDRPLVGTGVVLAGDAAGLAFAPSGEGILTAVESGQLAAETILEAGGGYARDRLAAYARRIEARFGRRGGRDPVARLPGPLRSLAARVLLGSSWLTRRLILEDGFLHLRRPAA